MHRSTLFSDVSLATACHFSHISFEFIYIYIQERNKTTLAKEKEPHTLERRWINCSRITEMKMKKKQTTASAHVGVYSREIPVEPPPAMTLFLISLLELFFFSWICHPYIYMEVTRETKTFYRHKYFLGTRVKIHASKQRWIYKYIATWS